jgi:beta-glucanase (GH16 family)
MKRFVTVMIASAAMVLGASGIAHADPDTDFTNQLHTYGIYGQKDYNAWIAKIACKRLYTNVDHDAFQSAKFISAQLQTGSTTEQSWQFLGAAIDYYCPEQRVVLDRAAAASPRA